MLTYARCREMTEEYLRTLFPNADAVPQRRLFDAMRYSLLAGGKRIRPALTLMFCEASGGDADAALPVACAVELLHTYSLIHDDLPCMDNDTLRRGRPTNHIVFGEYTATLAGDALQAEAFGLILRSDLPAETRAACAEALANAAGADGMCGGQQLDMEGDGRLLSEDELSEIQSRKTGALLSCACLMGAIAGNASEEQREAAQIFGACLGAAFQIRDDMLDVLSGEAELGKDAGSDAREGKTTFMSLLGESECQRRIDRLTEVAKRTVEGCFPNSGELTELAGALAKRDK